MLAPGLASGLEQATLSAPALKGHAPLVEWFELSTREDAALSPVSAKTVEAWQQAGWRVNCHMVHGPAFWQTTEIEDAPNLVATTTTALSAASA
jgi:hypothetical protein